jgi:dolichol-phosphate mannosyltransferase
MSGFFVISRNAFEASLPRLSGGGFKILLDIVASAPGPLKLVELPYVFRTRTAGESKLDLMVTAEYLKLLVDKAVGHIVPIRLLLFLIVGGLGVAVHLGVLGALLFGGIGFAFAQAGAVGTAMTFNFILNNIFTYSDRRLRGMRFFTACSASTRSASSAPRPTSASAPIITAPTIAGGLPASRAL